MLGRLIRQLRASASSGRVLRKPSGVQPQRAELLKRALAAQAQNDAPAAEAIYRELLEAEPDEGELLHLLGHLCQTQGRNDEAVVFLERAAAVRPDVPEIYFALGLARNAAGDVAGTIQAYTCALELKPDFAAALNNLATVYKRAGDSDGVERCYRRLIALDPQFASGYSELGSALLSQGRQDEAVEAFRSALAIDPDLVGAHTNLIYVMNFHHSYSGEEIFRAHLQWAERFAEPLYPANPPSAVRTGGRKLRVGYVSPNFYDHPVSYFFEPTLKNHDPEAFDVFCYSDVQRPDKYTERLQRYGTWRHTLDLDDDRLADLVRSDRIDILVDLTGHTDDNRLLMFARKPAPVQITWNGYAATTGMRAMDYRITDAYADPPGTTEHLHTEKLLRLADVYMAFEPSRPSPPVLARAPAEHGVITFVSANALSKIGLHVIATWARILQALPKSRLTMFTVPEGTARARLGAAFESHGIAASRIAYHGRLPLYGFLRELGAGDIALDPFPFAGTTTTCYTLWMGLPLITLAGRTHVSRVGVSFLSNLGLAELVARNEDEYVRLAVDLARDPERLAAYRGTLRDRMLASPLTDGPRLTRHLESAFRYVWNECC
jgi:predicted O-linked N-acetylglucosamine transferase (SPINDLY family)